MVFVIIFLKNTTVWIFYRTYQQKKKGSANFLCICIGSTAPENVLDVGFFFFFSGRLEALAICAPYHIWHDPCWAKAFMGWLRRAYLGDNTLDVSTESGSLNTLFTNNSFFKYVLCIWGIEKDSIVRLICEMSKFYTHKSSKGLSSPLVVFAQTLMLHPQQMYPPPFYA